MNNTNLFIQALVHDVYAQIKDNDEIEWDYTVKYVYLFDAYMVYNLYSVTGLMTLKTRT